MMLVAEWRQTYFQSISQFSPSYKPKFNKHWWSQDCNVALENLKQDLKVYKRNLENVNHWINYKRCKAKFKFVVIQAKKN